ncbi:MAG: glycosyltransferase family 2 protein, partial [Bacteroidales bacterium]|nr:glycosyltransferase family 2 protein [Bacteroidales bacterium]
MTLFGTYFETIPLILMALFAITFVFLALYYGLNHFRVSRYNASKTKPTPNNNAQPSVSVVLTSKNGEKLLTDNLTYLLEQNYPKLEVVVVDYDSFDNTQYVLQVFKSNYPDKLKIVRLEKDVNNYKGKKFPLSIG